MTLESSTSPPANSDLEPRRRVDGANPKTDSRGLPEAIALVVDRLLDSLVARANDDPELARAVRTIAASVLERLESAAEGRPADVAGRSEPPVRLAPDLPPPEVADPPRPDVVSVSEAISRLREGLGSGGSAPEATPPAHDAAASLPRWPIIADDELVEIERRCGIKARACRWCIERSDLLSKGADYPTEIAPRDRDLQADADEDGCRPWMLFEDPHCPPARIADLETLATCYDVLGEALSVVRTANAAVKSADPEADPEVYRNLFRDALHLLAEAQSALRVAVGHLADLNDDEQMATFFWLRRTTDEHRIYVERHMQRNDPADPGNSENLAARLHDLEEQIAKRSNSRKLRRKRIGNLRHACRVLREEDGADHEHWVGKIVTLVDELVENGDHPSNREIRELLLPVEEDLPGLDDVPENVAQVLRELDKYLSTRPSPTAPQPAEPTEAIRRVRDLLRGKSVMLIGGQRRRQQADALRDAFDLHELVWESSREHQSNDFFLPGIQREDVAVVLLMIRWSSHSFGDVKKFCDAAGKPLVRLKAGYHPNQVATAILEQCSDRLAEG